MDVFRLILSRLLPKTGQSYRYDAGDDGHLEIGWWKNTLLSTNRVRYISLRLVSDDIVIDNATGLMWAAFITAAGCNFNVQLTYVGGLAYSASLVFAGFTDWRLPNAHELSSIRDYSVWNPFLDTNYFTCTNSNYGTSTTHAKYTDRRIIVHFAAGGVTDGAKSSNAYFRAVRSL